MFIKNIDYKKLGVYKRCLEKVSIKDSVAENTSAAKFFLPLPLVH